MSVPPIAAISKLLAEAMAQAVSNGANSVSMPDHLVEIAAWIGNAAKPIDMVLHCPACGMQHIDAPEPFAGYFGRDGTVQGHSGDGESVLSWDNPPHRSHLCHYCDHIWRPADVCTNGVAAVKTKGKQDSPIPTSTLVMRPSQGLTQCDMDEDESY